LITIVDYGLGNIHAFVDIYRRLGVPVRTASSVAALAEPGRLILPGVGAFDSAMERLNTSGMRDTLERLVLEDGIPVLGVCVGMQMMAGTSTEGRLPGLNWIPGRVERFAVAGDVGVPAVPHMGWNDVSPRVGGGLFGGIEAPRFYFLHSYYYCTQSEETILSTTDYGHRFTSAVRSRNVFGTQFHPEKSHHWGVQLLKNFAEV